ncbi:hypothetical protein [Galbibacter pacificus]|uniref:Polysaccharide chain length determinant N-terminal domain-containing protein n=1 Tax=Galbibacter pacificus TaxID=2996052 RepID=A0ABT6FUA2_9FLAO|nr:hypothetical protein [Galbibacter pacificus]MDG3583345.1 hypothetical protein [Galbibacter pacificus]MDG3586826.1 hypothetical protein [Galbibacter pacificus]
MSEHTQPNNQHNNSEEIDLGQLFKLIGDGFRKFFNFIGDIFKGIFNIIISFLLFIQRHIIKFVIAGVIGVVVGVVLDMNKAPKYVSTMVVEPNFQSVQQLYNNINFYNELAEAEDSVALAEALGIEVHEAAAVKKITAESYSDENQKVKLFDEFVRSLDTTTRRAIDMEKYLENFNSFDARYHTIIVEATNSMVAKKLQNPIITSISLNKYFQTQKETSTENIELQKEILNGQLAKIDSLQQLYKRVMEKEASKPMQGTNISLGENGDKESRELALIREIDQIKNNLVEINEEEANKSSILNVISDFPRRGVEMKGIFKSYKFLVPIALLGILLLGLSLLELDKFLKEVARQQQK